LVIAIGSHGRNTGKTSAVCAVIRAFPKAGWTAVKISAHEPAGSEPYTLERETDREGRHDSSRYLAAGAVESYFLCHGPGGLAEAMPTLRVLLAGAGNVIFESNSILEFLAPDFYLFVLNRGAAVVKASAKQYSGRADAILTVEATAPDYLSRELSEFVRARLTQERAAPPSASET
jgi:hypothetical protein